MKSFLALAALVPLAAAHFTLDYPATRGFDEDLEPQFCGGFPDVSSTRQPFPLSGSAPILIDSHHPSAQVGILISLDSNPTSFDNFTTTSTGDAIPMLLPFGQITGTGEFCFNVDVGSLGLSNVTNGTVATIQVEFNGGDGLLLQCTDIVLVSDYTVPSNVTCANATATTSASDSASSSATATGSMGSGTSTPASGANKVGAAVGAVLAVVGAGVLML
ncbi:hypothetical protein BCR35DRAFT_262814 [Leucosporidium creatinivorum]|uniref:Copper acquisition factor BIM1-like domain-containing protein n=1 Tax=Leucosporidium creatinivorum TaxID=106004 RepID=A0A1Y2FYC5_9BASI|nr:hypothetical protein BCR35DRAFT_262814 [Leucosporidium creatinivorum]